MKKKGVNSGELREAREINEGNKRRELRGSGEIRKWALGEEENEKRKEFRRKKWNGEEGVNKMGKRVQGGRK